MSNKQTDEEFRIAFNYYRIFNKTKLQLIADVCGCSKRHLQGILSKKEHKSGSRNLYDAVAKFFNSSYDEFIYFGRWIVDGNLPDDYLPRSSISFNESVDPDDFDMTDEYFEHKVVCVTCKSIRGYVRGSFTPSACIGYCPKCRTALIHIR